MQSATGNLSAKAALLLWREQRRSTRAYSFATSTGTCGHSGWQQCSCRNSTEISVSFGQWSRHSRSADTCRTPEWNKRFVNLSSKIFGILWDGHPAHDGAVGRMSECGRWLWMSSVDTWSTQGGFLLNLHLTCLFCYNRPCFVLRKEQWIFRRSVAYESPQNFKHFIKELMLVKSSPLSGNKFPRFLSLSTDTKTKLRLSFVWKYSTFLYAWGFVLWTSVGLTDTTFKKEYYSEHRECVSLKYFPYQWQKFENF
jgi:hypothetical protein